MFAGIEAGGTKFNCVVAKDPDHILAETRIPTANPQNTIQEVVEFLENTMYSNNTHLQALGIGCFGPLDLDPQSSKFGSITSTPKTSWQNFNIRDTFMQAFHIPVALDTDVNAAAYGEFLWGAGRMKKHVLYITIGTGIGGGIIVNGKPLHGLIHPEMGHIFLPSPTDGGKFTGICPYHSNCFEGMASGPALEAQCGIKAEQLPIDHPIWEKEAFYIAQALCAYICILSPDIIILGGGVMQQMQLFPMIQKNVQAQLNGYIQSPLILRNIEKYIVPPGLGSRAGVLGALGLALQAEH